VTLYHPSPHLLFCVGNPRGAPFVKGDRSNVCFVCCRQRVVGQAWACPGMRGPAPSALATPHPRLLSCPHRPHR
jgi:hypothetical protein